MAEYRKLFNIEIKHDFYTDGISQDFDIVPLSATQQILKDNKLLFRLDQTGFRVLYRSQSGSDLPFIGFGGFDLRFALTLKNKQGFENITDLEDTVAGKSFLPGNIISFKNSTQTTTALDYEILDALKPSSFTFKFPQTASLPTDNGEIVILNEKGEDVTPAYPDPNAVKPDDNDEFYYPIDFSNLSPGQYTFTTTVNGLNSMTEEIYIDNELVRKNIFGICKIHVVDYQDFPTNDIYTADFVRRETIWRYKLIIKSPDIDISTDTLTIVDGESTYTFTKQADETTNGIPTAVFDSDTVIPYTQSPKKQLDFFSNAVLMYPNLANPPSDLVSAIFTTGSIDFGKSVIYVTI